MFECENKINIETAVIFEIQDAIDWYNSIQKGLGA